MLGMNKTPESALLRINEVASRLGKSRSTVYRIIASGALPTIHVGLSGARVHPADLDAYMRLNKIGEEVDLYPVGKVGLYPHRQRKSA